MMGSTECFLSMTMTITRQNEDGTEEIEVIEGTERQFDASPELLAAIRDKYEALPEVKSNG